MDSILVVCGAGASSSFLAHRMRKVAAGRGLSITIKAANQAGLEARLPDFDVLLVGPHLAADFDQLETLAAKHGVPAALLPEAAFGPGGDDEALTQALALTAQPAARAQPSQPATTRLSTPTPSTEKNS